MNKSMTIRDFETILDKAGIPIEVYGYEGILIKVSLQLRLQARRHRREGYDTLAIDNEYRAEKIHKLLEERGYFD